MKLGSRPRVLIVRLGAIGDVVNALVVANAIRKHRPDAAIGWAAHPLSAPLAETSAAIDQVHVLPRKGGRSAWKTFIQGVRSASYDVALDLQRLQKSGWIARRSGADRVIGFDRARCKELSWIWTKERIEPGPRREHMVLQYQRFLPLLGLPDEPPIRELGSDPQAKRWANEWLRERGVVERPVLLNLGASKPGKRWPKESFLALAKLLRDGSKTLPLVLTGGPGDLRESEWLLEAFSEGGTDGAPLLFSSVAQTTLPQLVALIRHASAMVTGDTGAMHMAAAVGVPTVALFGPSDPVRTGPFGEHHVVLHGERTLPRTDTVSLDEPRVELPIAGISPRAVSTALSGITPGR